MIWGEILAAAYLLFYSLIPLPYDNALSLSSYPGLPDFLVLPLNINFEAKGTNQDDTIHISELLSYAFVQISRSSLSFYGGISCYSKYLNRLIVMWLYI